MQKKNGQNSTQKIVWWDGVLYGLIEENAHETGKTSIEVENIRSCMTTTRAI